MKEIIEEHPSYAMLDIFRTNGSERTLFGSSIQHGQTICMKISRANKQRDLSRFWYHPEEQLVEIEMSPTQFIDAITNMNTNGVPVTLRYVNRERQPNPPPLSVKKLIQDEFKQDLKDIVDKSVEALNSLNKSLQPPALKKSDVREAISKLTSVIQDLEKNLPFVNQQFHRQMDKTITEAKGEIEAAFTNKIYSLGSEALVKHLEEGLLQGPQLIEQE